MLPECTFVRRLFTTVWREVFLPIEVEALLTRIELHMRGFHWICLAYVYLNPRLFLRPVMDVITNVIFHHVLNIA